MEIMKWIGIGFLGIVVVAAGVMVYLACMVLGGLGSFYEPWTKR